MHKITRQQRADEAAEMWMIQFPADRYPEKQHITQALKELPKGAPPDVIDDIIGNTSWTNLECDECGANMVEYVVEVGESQYAGSRTATLCGECISKLKQEF